MPDPHEGSASGHRHAPAQPAPSTLPLRTGERLTRREFERRYLANPDIKKVELVEGVTQVREPVGFYTHSQPHSSIAGILAAYAAYTPGVCAVVALLSNDVAGALEALNKEIGSAPHKAFAAHLESKLRASAANHPGVPD